MTIHIRQLVQNDLQEVVDLIIKTHRESFATLYPQLLIEDMVLKYTLTSMHERMQTITYYGAYESEIKRIVGIIGLEHTEIRTFFVDPDMQGKGVGKLLLTYVENKAKQNGLKILTVCSSPLGEPVYAKFGFKKVKDLPKMRCGIAYTDFFMEKDLAGSK